MRTSTLLITLVASNLLASAAESPLITTSYGALRGYSYTAEDGTEAQIFKKIPFASPPTGELRWRKPVAPEKWNSTLDNTFFGPACAQRTAMYSGPVTGFSEDCLHLNVYTSGKCRESSCPVVFVIHGGSGMYESTMKFPDEALVRNFVSQDIVVVSTAYRLGAFGAMALGDENVLPANLAMHDILAALQFTRSEIANFGGDKERITLFGQSEGGHYALMIAFSPGISKPGEKRQFKAVVSMSGPSGLETQEQTIQRSHACTGSAREIMACLRLLDTETIVSAAFKVTGLNTLSNKSPFGITMAGELFPISNELEMRESKVPMPGKSGKDKVNRILGIKNREECYEKYERDTATGEFDPGMNEVSQDMVIASHVFAKYQAEIGGEAYLYEYDYPVHGYHTDDAYFVLGFHEFEMDENEKWLSRVYPRYFTNFIRGERPAKDWSPVSPRLMNYYSVNRNITADVYPHMKYEYQRNIVRYYDGMVKYDNVVQHVKNMVLSAPVQYKSLNFNGDLQDFLESLTMVDALIFFCFLVGAICFLCCIWKCLIRILCCCFCCRKRSIECEHEPLIVYQYR